MGKETVVAARDGRLCLSYCVASQYTKAALICGHIKKNRPLFMMYGVAQKVSQYHESSFSRIKTRRKG